MSDDDARFEDGAANPLRLLAESPEDLSVISGLVQDAVLPGTEMRWQRGARRFALLINRYRWEAPLAKERVQSVLAFDDVTGVASQGALRDPDLVLSILSVTWEPGEDGTGAAVITFAGDGALRLEAECLNVTLQDVTHSYGAISGRAPQHPE